MAMIPPKTANDRFTDEQWQAIYQTGDNLLVAASAGSGKTTVLVQRIIEKIKNGVNVDELLVVTFTESAAVEMKERIAVAIQKAINQAVDDDQYRHLLRQTTLLPQANISTIHAFCLKVIQRFFYLIDVDPVFRIMADTIEVEMLKEDVWEDLKEELYADLGTDFRRLAKAYSGDRNDDGIKDLVFSLYNFSRANPDPALWLDNMGQLYDVADGLEQSKLFQTLLKPQIEEELMGILYDCSQAIHLGGEAEGTIVQRELLEAEKNNIESVYEAIRQNDYQVAFEKISTLNFKTWRGATKKNEEYKETIIRMKDIRDKYKKATLQLRDNLFVRSKAEHETIISETKPYVDEMARVTKLFTQAYWEKKLAGNTLDFNDLEHLTLEILMPLTDGKREASEASRYFQEKFEEVLIDEYQDVNQLQESILYGVTRHHPATENLFMVGDVKQSIYAFRLADPGLFLRKYQDFGQDIAGKRIILAENFRSRSDVIDFTNFIFRQLMDVQVGQMAYDNLAELKQGNTNFPATTSCQTEVMIYLKGEGESDSKNDSDLTMQADPETIMEIDDKATSEITMVAQKIRNLIDDKGEIYDKETKASRLITYKDIVLLTPTKKNNLLILETFKEYGIPVILSDSQSFFQRTEIATILSVLKIIDNPRQDIPLAAVLRSPIVGMNERQLASIRLKEPNKPYYDAVMSYLVTEQKNPNHEEQETLEKLTRFNSLLTHWRNFAKQENLVHLIWQIYNDTHFLDYVGGMSSGKQRVANLHAFYERAQKFEATNFKGLFQFIRFIERIQDRDQDLAEPTTFSEDEDAVRIMTIHASKGLEFPIVFVMDMSKRFNKKDIQGKYVFSEKYGIGTDYFDVTNRLQYTSLPRVALANEKERNLLAEEMRKLYVALTRAEQKLYLVGTYDTEEKMWQEWSAVDDSSEIVMPNHLRLHANNMMKWVGLALYRHHSINPDSLSKEYRGELAVDPVAFTVSFHSDADILGNILTVDVEEEQDVDGTIKVLADLESSQAITNDYKLAKKLMETTYPHEAATATTSYQSVSEIKRLFEDPDNAQLLQLTLEGKTRTGRYVEPDFSRPAFLQEVRQPTSAEVGTAVHYVMQQVDLKREITDATIEEMILQLVANGAIEENVVKRIDATVISGFFATELGKLIQEKADLVSREVPFTMLMKAGNLFEDISKDSDDNLLIHGIIDGFIEFEDHIILFDFKTDYVGNQVDKIINKYRGQMIVYREALEQIKNKKVTETYLCLLNTQENVIIE